MERRHGGILAGLGGAVTLLAVAALPLVTIDEAGRAVPGWQVATGWLAALLGAGALALAVGQRAKVRSWHGLALAGTALGQAAVLAWTWAQVWALVPCARLGLGTCDTSGGLLEGTLVTLDLGAWTIALGAILELAGALVVLVAPRRFGRDERFLRVLLSWDGQVVAERMLLRPAPVTIGEADGDTFQLPASGVRGHVLLAPQPDGRYLLDVPAAAQGRVTLGGREREAGDVAMARVGPGDQGRLAFENGVELAFTFTGAETASLASGWRGEDRGVLVSFCAVAALLLLFLGGLATHLQANRKAREEALAKKDQALIELTLRGPVEIEMPPPEEPTAQEHTSPVQPPPRDEGKRGEPERSHDRADHRPGQVVDKPRGNATDVTKMGIAQVLQDAKHQQGALGEVLAGGDGRLDSHLKDLSGDGGEDVQIGGGSGAWGFKGNGQGGPSGTGHDLKGLHDGGPLVAGPLGRKATPGIGAKERKHVPDPTREPWQAPSAGCDKGDIAKNVRSRAAGIRSCYEAQLLTRPDLEGKVTVQWTIGGTGEVTEAHVAQDSLHTAAVTDCVLRAMRHLRFKAPESGVCVVSWPFAFSKGN